jgi:hypothetical protein
VQPNYIRVDSVVDGVLPQRLSIADALKTRGTGFSFFTPALLFTHGGFDRDPVVEFGSYYSAVSSSRVFCVDLQREHEFFFRGFGISCPPGGRNAVNWNKRLYVASADLAADCFSFLGGIGWGAPSSGFFGRTFSYELAVHDPTVGPMPAENCTLTVRVFGVVAQNFVVFLDSSGPTPAVRKIFTAEPLAVLQSLGADIATYKTIVNPFADDAHA